MSASQSCERVVTHTLNTLIGEIMEAGHVVQIERESETISRLPDSKGGRLVMLRALVDGRPVATGFAKQELRTRCAPGGKVLKAHEEDQAGVRTLLLDRTGCLR